MWGLPSFALKYISPSIGSATTYLTIALAGAYFILSTNKKGIMWPFLILGLTYFTIAGLNYSGMGEDFILMGEGDREYFMNFLKFVLIVIFLAPLARQTKIKELFIILIFGALSVVLHSTIFTEIDVHFGRSYGRFSGFYLNPNDAATICLAGFALSYGIKNSKLKLLGQLIFSFAGLLTLSRTFFAIWVLINLLGFIQNKKNFYAPAIGIGALVLILSFGGEELGLQTSRFEALSSIFDSKQEVRTKTIGHDSRDETWATYYDIIMEKPFFGNGYKKLQGGYFHLYAGVHNTYLMVIGESGVIPFLILISIIGSLIFNGFLQFKIKPEFSFLSIAIAIALLVSHNYFERFPDIFLSLFLYSKIVEKIQQERSILK